MARCMLKAQDMPNSLWAEAVNTVVYILNRSYTKALKGMNPQEAYSDDEDESDDSEDLKAEEEKPRKSTEASEDSDGSEDDDDDSDNEAKQNFSSINKAQAEPKTPAIDDGYGSKTVFVKNLAWSVDEDVVRDFFKSAGGIKEVRLAMDSDGRFRGFGHVEFLSAAAAKKACEKSGEVLAGRDIFVDLAKERLFSPGSEGNKDFRSPRGGFSGFGGQRPRSGNTAFVKGFNKFQDEDSIRSSLSEFFDECGIQNIRIPTDRETGHIKGFAYVDFNDKSGLDKAVEYNGSDLDGRSLFIEEAGGGPPSSGGRGRGRGDFGGRGGFTLSRSWFLGLYTIKITWGSQKSNLSRSWKQLVTLPRRKENVEQMKKTVLRLTRSRSFLESSRIKLRM
ncbi:hypothetical protein KP509_13G070500 [Ceratopteris richardii]|uniref:RRM domain-containing protein n=1 Tax=Ceratopteris richardii TaxID=49495 RepID=A0A8T2TJR0_CERRI|nr:hypothetical protein KP509_13G070500 [Ceratopteris richardii]